MTKDIRFIVEQFDNGITLRDSEEQFAIIIPDRDVEKELGELIWQEIDNAMSDEKTSMAEVRLQIEVKDEH